MCLSFLCSLQSVQWWSLIAVDIFNVVFSIGPAYRMCHIGDSENIIWPPKPEMHLYSLTSLLQLRQTALAADIPTINSAFSPTTSWLKVSARVIATTRTTRNHHKIARLPPKQLQFHFRVSVFATFLFGQTFIVLTVVETPRFPVGISMLSVIVLQ